MHGFDLVTPVSLQDGLPHSITVKYGQTDTDLFGTSQTIVCAP